MPTPTQSPQRTKCEIYTRVMWYFRPVSHFNIWKKAEHYNRLHFHEQQSASSRFILQYPTDDDSLNPKNDADWLST